MKKEDRISAFRAAVTVRRDGMQCRIKKEINMTPRQTKLFRELVKTFCLGGTSDASSRAALKRILGEVKFARYFGKQITYSIATITKLPNGRYEVCYDFGNPFDATTLAHAKRRIDAMDRQIARLNRRAA